MDEIKNNLCRCCLINGTSFKNMLCEPMDSDSAKLENSKIFDFFLTFSESNNYEQHKITTKICSLCETKLYSAFTFKQLILQSNKCLCDQVLEATTIKEEKPELTQGLSDVVNPLVLRSTDFELKDENVTQPKARKRKAPPSKVAAITPRKKKRTKCEVPESVVLQTAKIPASSGRSKSPKKQRGRPKVHTKEEQTTCSFCNKEFPTEFQMRRHLDIHKKPNFMCDDCGKLFTDKQRLKTHMVAHSDERTIKCPLCPSDKGFFKDKRYLRQHNILTHNNDKRDYICAVCDHTTKTLQSLKTHLATHFVQLRNFVCEICNHRYVFPRDLSRHIQRTHRRERPYKCDKCPKTYMAAHVLAAHIKVVHNNFRFACKYCDKAYNGTSALLEHLFSHRDDKPYNCPECSNGYISWTNFKNHLSKCHNLAYNPKVHGYKGSFPEILKAGMKQPETSNEAETVFPVGNDALFENILQNI